MTPAGYAIKNVSLNIHFMVCEQITKNASIVIKLKYTLTKVYYDLTFILLYTTLPEIADFIMKSFILS